MSNLFADSSNAWAALVIVLLPLLIIGAGELEERLRQRDSPFQASISIIRVWIVPVFTLWVLSRALFDVERTNPFVRLLSSAVVLAGAAVALSALRVAVAGLIDRSRRSGRRQVPRLLLAMPRLLIFIGTGWFLIAGIWGVDVSSALTALGVTSLVISFALQPTLSGIASGFTLLADQPFGPGDWIEAEDVEGRVLDVNWRSTRIQDRNGDLVVIPNGQLANATITNYDQPSRLHRVAVPVQIERSAPPTAAKEMLLDAARSTPGVLEDPPPFVVITQIADPVVDYLTYMWVDDYTITPRAKADFSALVWYLSYRHGVPLPNPAQDLYLFDGAKTAIESETTPSELRRRLLDSPLLQQLDDDVLDRLANGAVLGAYQKGETIVTEGAQQDLMLLHRGRARLVLRQPDTEDFDVLAFEAGELLGVIDEPLHGDRTAAVTAVTDCDVVTIPSEVAGRAIAAAAGLGAAIEQLALARRRRIDRVVRRAARRTAHDTGTEPTHPGIDSARDRGVEEAS